MRVEKNITLQADASTVWDALTNPKQTERYFFGCQAISDWQVGSSLIFKTNHDGQEMIHVKGVILAVEPNRQLKHTCFAAEHENDTSKHTTATYTLTPVGDATELAVTQGEFPDDDTTGRHSDSWDQALAGLKALVESES